MKKMRQMMMDLKVQRPEIKKPRIKSVYKLEARIIRL